MRDWWIGLIFLTAKAFTFRYHIHSAVIEQLTCWVAGKVKLSEEEALTFKYKNSHTVHRNFGCLVLPKIYAQLGVIGHFVLSTNEFTFAKYSAEFMQIYGSVAYDLKSLSLVILLHDLYH